MWHHKSGVDPTHGAGTEAARGSPTDICRDHTYPGTRRPSPVTRRDGSVGRIVMRNILESGFEASVWPVNPKYSKVAGRRCYHAAEDLLDIPDLAIIITPETSHPTRL
ncbi:CoA-binding protein [Borborobacter arsenicus]